MISPPAQSESAARSIRVMVAGLRGFPNVQGGIETHCQQLYPRLTELGCQVEVVVRSPFTPADLSSWNGVRFQRVWAPRVQGVEAFLHTFLAVLVAAARRPDILHIHAIGPGLFAPLARLCRLKVVLTHHGADYQRDKWGWFAKGLLRLGESVGMRFANGRIAVSRAIAEELQQRFELAVDHIPNGVVVHPLPAPSETLQDLGLVSGRYVLTVGRLVPEKRQLDLLEAFQSADLNDWKLVLVGTAAQRNRYTDALEAAAAASPDVVLAGFRGGQELAELYANAGQFVLPSAHEGLPIVVLEALSYGLRVVASDIPANLEVGLASNQYYPLGDIAALTSKLRKFAADPLSQTDRHRIRESVRHRYDWSTIARQTLRVYENVLHRTPSTSSNRGVTAPSSE